MTDRADEDGEDTRSDRAPGDGMAGEGSVSAQMQSYLIGLALAVALTCASFYAAKTGLIWKPGVPAALVALAVAQMGVHLAFFLHITTGADNTNNVLALAFGVLIVTLLAGGSIWIMAHLNHNMPTMDQIMRMQR